MITKIKRTTNDTVKIEVFTDNGNWGTLHLTTGRYHKAGQVEGNLTPEEKSEVKKLSYRDGKWHDYTAPRPQSVARNARSDYENMPQDIVASDQQAARDVFHGGSEY